MLTLRRPRRPPPHLRISLVGCGAIARWLLRPLLAYLHEHAGTTFEVTVIDGEGDKAHRLAADALPHFPAAVVKVVPEYLILATSLTTSGTATSFLPAWTTPPRPS